MKGEKKNLVSARGDNLLGWERGVQEESAGRQRAAAPEQVGVLLLDKGNY